MKYGRVKDRALESLRKIVESERISIGESILDLHAKDESFHERRKPDVVVWPLNAEEISEILKLANEKRISVTPWGAGTS
jgi:D-lactate dehydrogenase (cytochrome)